MQVSHFARVTKARDRDDVIGTAYPVSDRCLLTAGHVVQKLGAEVGVVWGAERVTYRCKARCTWIRNGDAAKGELDAAVLELVDGTPPGGLGAYLTSQPLRVTSAWESRGFPLAGDAPEGDDGVAWTREIPMHGEAFAFAADAAVFQVTVEKPPKRLELWRGISGAPVFVGGVICGIITDGAGWFEGNRLQVVPTCRLLADETFVEAVALRQSTPEFAQLRRYLCSSLDAHDGARRELFEVAPDWEVKYQTGKNDGIDGLVEAMLTCRVAQLVKHFDEAHAGCYIHDPQALETAVVLAAMLAKLLPWLSIQSLVSAGPGASSSVWPLPASNATAAELLMAGFDERKYEYGELVRGLPYPTAEVAVRSGLVIDVDGRLEFRKLSTHLAEWLLAKRIAKDRDLTHRQLAELNQEIQHHASRRRGAVRYYLVLDAAKVVGNEPFLQLVGQHLPALAVVILREDTDADEATVCRHLRDLIHRARTGEEYTPQ